MDKKPAIPTPAEIPFVMATFEKRSVSGGTYTCWVCKVCEHENYPWTSTFLTPALFHMHDMHGIPLHEYELEEGGNRIVRRMRTQPA